MYKIWYLTHYLFINYRCTHSTQYESPCRPWSAMVTVSVSSPRAPPRSCSKSKCAYYLLPMLIILTECSVHCWVLLDIIEAWCTLSWICCCIATAKTLERWIWIWNIMYVSMLSVITKVTVLCNVLVFPWLQVQLDNGWWRSDNPLHDSRPGIHCKQRDWANGVWRFENNLYSLQRLSTR